SKPRSWRGSRSRAVRAEGGAFEQTPEGPEPLERRLLVEHPRRAELGPHPLDEQIKHAAEVTLERVVAHAATQVAVQREGVEVVLQEVLAAQHGLAELLGRVVRWARAQVV